MSRFSNLKQWAKHSSHPAARLVRNLHALKRSVEIPKGLTLLYRPVFNLHRIVAGLISGTIQTIYWTPLFKSQIKGTARRLNLYGGLPLVTGPLEIECGDDCRISGATTFSARTSSTEKPKLSIGNNVGIGWQTTIASGSQIILNDNVRMGGRNFLAGYPGHPIDATERAKGLPDHDEQVGDIILEKDVWLGTGVMVMAGVHIGQGSIVAAGSVVTKSLPANVLAGGNPARVIRPLYLCEVGAAQ